ncbi:MAG: 2-amino-3-carboxymuconate-6-semialdehyde decarboxylase, partial [Verrucomicrobia bacterium]
MKIDLHTHVLPRDWPDLDQKYGYGGFVRLEHSDPCSARMMIGDRVFREITDRVWNPERRIEDMDNSGVSMQVLSTVPVMFSYWAKPRDALDLCRLLNDHIAE